MKLEYGMLVKEKGSIQIGEITKYWSDDEDANSYKVRVTYSENESESFYSSDLSLMIERGQYEVV